MSFILVLTSLISLVALFIYCRRDRIAPLLHVMKNYGFSLQSKGSLLRRQRLSEDRSYENILSRIDGSEERPQQIGSELNDPLHGEEVTKQFREFPGNLERVDDGYYRGISTKTESFDTELYRGVTLRRVLDLKKDELINIRNQAKEFFDCV